MFLLIIITHLLIILSHHLMFNFIEEKQVNFAHLIQSINVLLINFVHLLMIIEYLSQIIIQNVLFKKTGSFCTYYSADKFFINNHYSFANNH